jgi:hypothetical protein
LPSSELDQNKENIYPLLTSTFLAERKPKYYLTFKITVIQQRDSQPIKTDSKLLVDTNYLDNVNGNICTAFFNVLTGQNNAFNIELSRTTENPYAIGVLIRATVLIEVTLTVP